MSKDGGRDLAYALYVLASNGVAPLGDLRYIADAKLDDLGNADRQGADRRGARHAGRQGARRARLCVGARSHQAAGSSRSCSAASITARRCATRPRWSRWRAKRAARARPSPARCSASRQARADAAYTSTQEKAWLVLAARAMAKDSGGMSLDVNGEQRKGSLYRNLQGESS